MRTSIIIKIFVSFLLVSLLPIAALIAYNDWANRKIVYDMKIEEIKKHAGKIARSIDRELSEKKSAIRSLCGKHLSGITGREVRSDLIKTRLERLIKSVESTESVFVLDSGGDIVTHTHEIPIRNYGDRDFFKEAMKGEVYVSEPAMEQGAGYIYYSAPIGNDRKEIVGVLVMMRQAEGLWKLIEEERDYMGKGSLCILTDAYGVRIAHATDRSLIFKSWVMLDPGAKNQLETKCHYGEDVREIGFTTIPEVSKALARSSEFYFIHPLVINTENNHGYCVPLEEKNWKLIYTVPASTFLSQVRHLTRNAIFSSGIVFAVIVAVTWLLSVSLLRPIKRLMSAADEIANGKLDHPMSINGPRQDEIGKLMQSFDVMRHKLSASYRELKDANTEAILMLARACEVRDENTGNHVLRIKQYSTALAKEMGLDESFVKELGTSSILHDVGKIHIADCILRKQGSFTAEEREEIKKHPALGDRILGEGSFFQMAREIARWHHENWDGTGYPDGLKGEAIPVSARIVRLADTYDALVTRRPYKHAWPDRAAYDNIIKYSGKYFDPTVVGAFKRLFEKGIFQKIEIAYT